MKKHTQAERLRHEKKIKDLNFLDKYSFLDYILKEVIYMPNVYTLTKAKAELSSIINDVQTRKEKIFITKKKKNVAVIMPFSEYARNNAGNGLLNAAGAVADAEIDNLIESIYSERGKSSEREVAL